MVKLPDISDALKPLPRLKSLVLTEIETIRKKTPIDRKVFIYAFSGVFSILLLIAIGLPFITPVIMTWAGKHPTPSTTETVPEIHAASTRIVPQYSDQQRTIHLENDTFDNAPLPFAPIKALEEPFANQTIPTLSNDGRKVSDVYARPYNKNDTRPRISVVIAELGLSRQISETAIRDLPGAVTLAFSTFSSETSSWMARARQMGHEVLLSIPMEPLDYPASDPGPRALLVQNSNDKNNDLLLNHLINGKGYIGVTSLSGSRINTSPDKLRPILNELNARGLMWLDANLSPLSTGLMLAKELGLPASKVDIHIDENMGDAGITRILKYAENNAVMKGHFVIIVEATPFTLSRLREWIKTLPSKSLSLAPLSAVLE